MRKIIFINLLIILLISLFPACKKDPVSQNIVPVDTSTSPVAATLLTAFYTIDTTVTTGYDTISRAHCYYDNQNRAIRIESYQTDPVNGDTTGSYIFRYFYPGSDTLAEMSVEDDGVYTNGTLTESSSDTISYVFSNGKCIYDSSYGLNSLNQPSYSVYEYQYLPGNKLMLLFRGHSPSITYTKTTTMYQTVDASDILHQIDTTINT